MSLRSSFLCDLDSVKSNASGGISSEDQMMKAIPYLLLFPTTDQYSHSSGLLCQVHWMHLMQTICGLGVIIR